MKKLTIIFLLSFGFVYAKSNSNSFNHLIQTWSYLQYHAPDVLKGKVDWDRVFQKSVDSISDYQMTNSEVTNYLLFHAGLPNNKKYISEIDHKVIVNLDFLNEKNFENEDLEALIKFRENYKYLKNDFYRYERVYYIIDYRKDKSLNLYDHKYKYQRLLSISKFWAKINYFYVGKRKMIHSCAEILDWAINNLEKKNDNTELERILINMNHALIDAHAFHLKPPAFKKWGQHYHSPITLEIQNNKLYVTYVFSDHVYQNGLILGDEITSINGVPVEKGMASYNQYFELSNKRIQEQFYVQEQEIYYDRTLKLEVKREDEIIDIKIPLNVRRDKPKFDIPEQYGYINPRTVNKYWIWSKDFSKYVDPILKNHDTVVVDLRNAFNDDSKLFLHRLNKRLKIESESNIQSWYPNKKCPLPGAVINDYKPEEYSFLSQDGFYEGTIIVLVDNSVGSQTEINAIGLRLHKNSMVIGSKTWGTIEACTDVQIAGEEMKNKISHGEVYLNDHYIFDHHGVPLDYEIDYSKKPADFKGKDWFIHQTLNSIKNYKRAY